MFKDRVIIWVLEYIFGGVLVLIPLAKLGFSRFIWMDTHIWAAYLFVVCLGVILISCASSMRQRMLLAHRMDRLVKRLEDRSLFSL